MPFALKPLIVLSDLTILCDEQAEGSAEASGHLAQFAELVKSPGNLHTYRMTNLTLWNAASLGLQADDVIATLEQYSRYGIPSIVSATILQAMNRYGRLKLERTDDGDLLLAGDQSIIEELNSEPTLRPFLTDRNDKHTALSPIVRADQRGAIKQELARLGYPVIDEAGYREGEKLVLALRSCTREGKPFNMRDYQRMAVERFRQEGAAAGGSGVIVLPCGAGKTIVGIGVLAGMQCAALILTSNLTSVKQWKNELLDKTTLDADSIGEYSSMGKQVRPVTIATYNMLATTSSGETRDYRHMRLFNERDWGLIIYDEVHMLPAPVFRMTADLQATRRLGLTATLVREDGRERDVFSLIGPKQYELPWKQLEKQGHIAELRCEEVRVPLPAYAEYYTSDARMRTRLAAENPNKIAIVRQLLKRHPGKPALIIGAYLHQLKQIANRLQAPLLTGEVPQEERNRLYDAFRRGEQQVLVVSKVANFAVDLPDAAVAVQVSGTFGSRQEEAQRIGRLLRPKADGSGAVFYTLVSEGTAEVDYAMKRQRFMMEQGYRYGLTAAFTEGESLNENTPNR